MNNSHETPFRFRDKAFDRVNSVEKPPPQRLRMWLRGDGFVKDQVLLPQGLPLFEVDIDRTANQDLCHFLVPNAIALQSPEAARRTAARILVYPVQRQRLPDKPIRISSSVGFGLPSSKACADMIMPGVQNPH